MPKLNNRVGPKPLHWSKQPHWYKQHIGSCPLCGRDKSYKEMVLGVKPTDLNQVYIQLPWHKTYDHCDVGL